jgi:hypothetical protein
MTEEARDLERFLSAARPHLRRARDGRKVG